MVLPCHSYNNYYYHTHGMALKTSGIRRLYYTYSGRPAECLLFRSGRHAGETARWPVCMAQSSSNNDMDVEHGSRGGAAFVYFSDGARFRGTLPVVGGENYISTCQRLENRCDYVRCLSTEITIIRNGIILMYKNNNTIPGLEETRRDASGV